MRRFLAAAAVLAALLVPFAAATSAPAGATTCESGIDPDVPCYVITRVIDGCISHKPC